MATALFIVFGVALVSICVSAAVFGTGWLFALKRWKRITLLTSIVAVGLLAAWRAAVEAERAEPVWMTIATGVRPLQVPIRVRMAPDLDTYLPAAQQAMRLWNEQAGCRLFVEEPADSPLYDVRVVFLKGTACGESFTVQPDPQIAASTYFCDNGAVDISVERLDEIQESYVVFAHEFGHVLGLAHDPIGLMAPQAHVTLPVLPNPKDIRAIRERYCTGVAP